MKKATEKIQETKSDDQISAAPSVQNPPAAPIDKDKQKNDEEFNRTIKELDSAFFAVKFYPVAVNETAKDEAAKKIIKTYETGNETVRQLVIYLIHESISQSGELRILHNLEYFKAKFPSQDAAQLRMNVYRAMFNYNTSIEGLIELIDLVPKLTGSDDGAKLLTYHFSHLSTAENEANHMLRSAILEALGKCDSIYALKALLKFARHTSNDHTFQRVAAALFEWNKRIDEHKMLPAEKEKMKTSIHEILTSDFGGSHYG